MPNISNKGESMPQSPIRKLVPFAEIAKKSGIYIYQIYVNGQQKSYMATRKLILLK